MASTSPNAQALSDFFDHLVRCETRLYNAMGEQLQTRHGIPTAQFEYLRYLHDHPDARVAEIATAFAAGVGAISKLTDRLVAKGWVVRRPNPADGRSSLLRLTRTGANLATRAQKTLHQSLDELITDTLTGAELAAAASALATLRESLERAGIGVPTG